MKPDVPVHDTVFDEVSSIQLVDLSRGLGQELPTAVLALGGATGQRGCVFQL